MANTFSDSLSEETLNPLWWTVDTSSGNCTVALTNGSVVMTQGTSGDANLVLSFMSQGDFSAAVDYALLYWPYNNGERLGIRTSVGAVERISDNGFGGETYTTDVNHVINISAPTSDVNGTLKIERIGTVTTGYYLNSGSWTQIGSTDSGISSAVSIELSIWPAGITPGVEVAFSNFSVTASNISSQLAIIRSGADVILTWPTNVAGFTLQSTTNLVSVAAWSTVSPGPVVINGQNTVTNAISLTQTFYRLSQ